MRVALVYPPSCDPTAPYLSVPTLTAWLRKHGVDVIPIDANLEAWEHLLRPDVLAGLASRVERRVEELDRAPSLSHADQLAYTQLFSALGDAAAVPLAIERALATLRDRERFHDPAAYEGAVSTIEAALRVVSAAYAPLAMDMVAYRTPFSLLTADEIARDSEPDRDPFHDYFMKLADRLAGEGVGLVGISVAFPGQIQPAYALARAVRARVPSAHVVVGGPAITQILVRLSGPKLDAALGPFHTAVVQEGEIALLDIVQKLSRGEDPAANGRVIRGTTIEDMSVLPAPDYDGLPLDRYLSPELVLPYDPTRGCYWGVCTFCHYGLAEVGTAKYRERPAETVLDHLEALSKKHGSTVFYFSQDVFSPRVAAQIARGITARGLPIRWGTDMRPERSLTPERCEELVRGGALSTALGVESASPRVLSLIDKGIPADDVRSVIQALSGAGVAVEAMCFSDFPTETYREAMETVRFVRGVAKDLSLFILGRFDLTHGSLVAQKPGDFGIREVWNVEGDDLGTGLFFAERQRSKRPDQQEKLEEAVGELSSRWRLHRYPWAGALSTAHTMLWYREHGKDVFRRLGAAPEPRVPGARPRVVASRYDVARIAEISAANEAAIWEELVQRRRRVGRSAYQELADALPRAKPSPGRWRVEACHDPVPAGPREGKPRRDLRGRRPSHASNATKP
jgi:anaerobic magnesium-protoporphyrin IX monomethyl ester cyclase